jgi:uncharacterized protein YcaQ
MLHKLRQQAIAASLFRPTTLRQAVERMGFVQADPIQAPARAQDLILRHRVKDYRVGDLERHYHRLGLEEDRLYAHGFMPRSTWRLLHPRCTRRLSGLEKRVLEVVTAHKRIHPGDLEAYFGRQRATNGWGGQSKATTRALHFLHHYGFLRIAGREQGIRVYEAIANDREPLDSANRYRQLVLAIASALGPLSDRGFRAALAFLGHRGPVLKALRSAVPTLVESGELVPVMSDGVRYLWRVDRIPRNTPNQTVRFLAPFDPLVWDRERFEHFWDWQYRFEAYVPAPKRSLGYYAMPLLWRDDVIGWVNASNQGGKLRVEAGFKKAKPKERAFRIEFQSEVARLETFLQKRTGASRSRQQATLTDRTRDVPQ